MTALSVANVNAYYLANSFHNKVFVANLTRNYKCSVNAKAIVSTTSGIHHPPPHIQWCRAHRDVASGRGVSPCNENENM